MSRQIDWVQIISAVEFESWDRYFLALKIHHAFVFETS